MRVYFFLSSFLLLVLLGCDTTTQQKQQTNLPDSTIKINLSKFIDLKESGHPIEIERIQLNEDSVPDYFVIEHSGNAHGFFFDGKTQKEIPTDAASAPWSRPGVELEYKIIDLLCSDPQKEILIKGGSGGTVGLTLTTTIYRFDPSSGKMKIVFEKDEFSSHFDEDMNEITDETNYIGLQYGKDSCDIIIVIAPGKFMNDTIIPITNSKETVYRFDKSKNLFEISQ